MNQLPADVERLLSEVVEEAEAAFHPLLIAGRDPVALSRFLHQYGWDVQPLLGTDPGVLVAAIRDLDLAFRSALALVQGAASVDEIGAAVILALEALRDLLDQAEAILDGVLAFGANSPDHHTALVQALARDTGEHLLLRYLAGRAPLLLALARLVGFVGPRQVTAIYASETDTSGEPIRFPMLRLAINERAMSDAILLPVRVVVDYLGPEAFRSVDAFFAGVQRALLDMLAPLLPYLDPGQVTEIAVTVTLDGVSLDLPGIFPAIGGIDQAQGFSIPLKRAASQVAGAANVEAAEFPVLVLKNDGLALNWSATSAADEVSLVDGLLYLSDTFPGTAIEELGIRFRLDVEDLDNPRAALSLASALRLVTGDVENHIGLEFGATLDAAGAFSLAAVAEAAPDLVLPTALPGLDGMAFVASQPVARLSFHGDQELALRTRLEAAAFGLRLPTTLVRKASRLGDAWQLEEGGPEVRFSLSGGERGPLADVRFGTGGEGTPGGLWIADLALVEPGAGTRLTVTSDAIFVGFDSPETGFVIEIAGFDWQFDTGSSLLGGISIEKATVHFPKTLEVLDTVEIAEATINDRGFSGAVSILFEAEASSDADPAPDGAGPESARPEPLFGILPIQLYSLHLEFVDSLPVAFDLKAAIQFPYFGEWVDLTIGIDDGFDIVFKVESTDPEGIVLTKDELLALTFRSAGFAYYHDLQLLRLSLSGGIEPLLWNADGLEWPRLDVTNLVLEQDLSAPTPALLEPPVLKFEEAWLDLKDLATLDLFGFYFELNRIGIGYLEETDKLWLDLTGSLRLIDLIPIGLGVEGFRLTWPRRIYEELGIDDGELSLDDLMAVAGRIEVKFDGVYLFYGIPQAVEFEGYIRFIKEAQKVGFAGDVALRVPASGLAIEAGLLVGMNFEEPPYPFLYVYFGILLPTGIPLGQSGLALKGARGLLGLNVFPDRTPEQNPYYDWYKRGPIEGAHPTNKWRDQIWSIAFGAGITITTTDGKILGVRGLLALVIPGPILFVEGKALVFDGIFPSDGPLKALGYFDGNELTAQFNIEAGLELVEGVVDVNAGLEAFFDFQNLANWHLYLGKDQPPGRRVRANFLKLPMVGWLFEANSYLMLDMATAGTLRARLGAHIGFEPPAVDLVVASAKVRAVIEGLGQLTVNPFQFHGRLALDAVVDVQAFGLSVVGVEAAAQLAVEGARPLVVDARVHARVDLPVPNFDQVPVVGDWAGSALDWFEESVADLPDIPEYIALEVPFHWEFDGPPAIEPLVKGVALESRLAPGGVEALAAASEAFDIWQAPRVPLDARPVILFDQNMNQAEGLSFGGFASGGPQRFYSGNLAFRPRLHDVAIWRLPLQRYDPAVDPGDQAWQLVGRASETDAARRLWGAFRPEVDAGDAGWASRRSLDLWTANVFEFLTGTLPLALPADDAERDRPPVPPGEGYLAAGGLQWCTPGTPREGCIGEKELEKAARDGRQRPVLGPHGDAFRQRLTVEGLDLAAHDLRLTLPGRRQRGQPALHAAAPPRERAKLIIHFPEPVVSARLVQPPGSKIRLKPLARRRGDVSLVESTAGRQKSLTPQPGEPCAVPVPVDVQRRDTITEVVAEGQATGGSDGWFDCLHVVAEGQVDLVKICWRTAAEAEAAAVRTAECEHNAGLGAHGGELPVVLSAGSLYRIEATTSIRLDEPASDWATLALCRSIPAFYDSIAPFLGEAGSEPETSVYFFQTAGPPQDLRPYVKWASPQHQSTGHFHEDDFVVRFNRPYVHRLYPDPDTSTEAGNFPYAIDALLRDAEGHVIRGFFHNWTTARSATLFPDEKAFLEAAVDSPSPVDAPPPDDILEIRRQMLIRSIADLGAEDWQMVPLQAPEARPPKWQRQADGSVHIAAAGNQGGSLYLAKEYEWTDFRFECAVEVPAVAGGAAGAVFGYSSRDNHYQLRIRLGQKPKAQIMRVRDGQEIILDEQALGTPRGRPGLAPFGPLTPVRMAIRTRLQAEGLVIQAAVGGARLSAGDGHPPAGGARFGFYARDVDAVFPALKVTGPRQELAPGARYSLLLTGGEGGRTVLADDFFSAGLGDHWLAEATSWTSGDGLRASNPGATIALDRNVEDGELVTVLEMEDGDAVGLRLRVPDAARAADNRTAYELVVERTANGCDVAATAVAAGRTGSRAVTQALGRGQAELGPARRFPLRVRLIGDSLRAWVFEQVVIDVRLQEYQVEVALPLPVRRSGRVSGPVGRRLPAGAGGLLPTIGSRTRRVTLPLAWSGRLEWTIVRGAPVIRSVDLRAPELLRLDFTASEYGSFAGLMASTEAAPEALVVAGYEFGDYAGHVPALVQSQRVLADARLALLGTQALFAAKRADRQAIEGAKQKAVRATADHDAALAALLGHFGVAYERAPDVPKIRRLETDDGQWLGFLLQSPRPLEPELLGLGDSEPFASLGRTRFSLSSRDHGPVPTGWIASGDGATLLLYQRAGQGPPGPDTDNAELAPAALVQGAYELAVEYIRHHHDDAVDEPGVDHLYDRPYILSRSSREPARVSGIVL